MATHGHRGLADVLWGTVASELRHITMVPVLMVLLPAALVFVVLQAVPIAAPFVYTLF